MAQNKNAVIRYKALDKCFSNPYKKFYINDLIEYCSNILSEHYAIETTVSRRQIFDDMDFMKSEAGYDAPIVSIKDGRKVFYRYSDPEFTILKAPLNPSELASLSEAIDSLKRLNSIPGFDWVNSIEAKLKSGLNLQDNGQQIISFEDNQFLKGIEYLNTLYHFILNKQTINISYKSFQAEYYANFNISPYFLKQYNNRWFLFGWNHLGKHLQNLALDRIHSIEISQDSFIENQINFDDYFEDVIGVSNDLTKDPVIVLIALSENIIPYIKSKPIHGSQKINENILSLEVKLNYELEALILSYGENMQVIEPEELVNSLKNRISKISLLY